MVPRAMTHRPSEGEGAHAARRSVADARGMDCEPLLRRGAPNPFVARVTALPGDVSRGRRTAHVRRGDRYDRVMRMIRRRALWVVALSLVACGGPPAESADRSLLPPLEAGRDVAPARGEATDSDGEREAAPSDAGKRDGRVAATLLDGADARDASADAAGAAYRVTRADPAPSGAKRPSFTQCVLHSGSASGTRHRVKLADGGARELPPSRAECASDAECVRHDAFARAAGGQDGFARLSCAGRRCECRLDRIVGSVTEVETYRETFELETACADAALARRLLEELCLREMPRARP